MILYISCHSILEYDELLLLSGLGYDVFSLGGAYTDPKGHFTLPRPGIPSLTFHEDLMQESRDFARTAIPYSFLKKFDKVIIMHAPDVVTANWPTFKQFIQEGGRVIWRSIGQSTQGVENKLRQPKAEGLEIVRYSPKEENIPDYVGSNALIRFYKDPEEYKGWNGSEARVINFTQSLKGRRTFVHHDEIMHVIQHYKGTVYGTGNEDLGEYNGGEVTYQKQNEILRNARVAIYGGTWPACYTLSIMEYMMTGIPVVVINKAMAMAPVAEKLDFYEVEEIIQSCGGMVANSYQDLIDLTYVLLNNYDLAKAISTRQRDKAIELFGKERIAKQWRAFLQ